METELGPPKGMAPGLRPVAMDGGDCTWRMKKVESDPGDRSLRLRSAHLNAFILSSLPSTATTTQPRFPASDMANPMT